MGNLLLLLFFAFMSVVFAIYCLVPKKYKYIVLLIFSLAFFAIYSKFMIAFFLATIVSIYCAGIWLNKISDKQSAVLATLEDKEQKKKIKKQFLKKKKWVIAFAVIFNVAILAVLKYSGFFASIFEGILSWFNLSVELPVLKLLLPLGISYYTLSAIGYVIDVYRGKYRGETNFCKVALFVSYFPQLWEGPFARFNELAPQLYNGASFDVKRVCSGITLVLWGLLLKFVVADRLAIVTSEVFSNYAEYSGIIIVLGILFFTFQLYAEFAGLINVASGISEMFGIKLAKNFNQPFFSQNVSEFWRRWHISLGAWFKEYIFYPISMSKGIMSLNKKLHGKASPFVVLLISSAISLFVVWFLNGLWHGAEWKYVVYGLYYYVLTLLGMCIEPLANKIYKKANINANNVWLKTFRIIKTFILVNIGMLIFRATDLSTAWAMFAGIFSGGTCDIVGAGVIDIADSVLCFVGIFIVVMVDVLREKNIDIREILTNKSVALRFVTYLVMIFAILLFGAYGDGYQIIDPIYGGF